jgi:hypothetical protein
MSDRDQDAAKSLGIWLTFAGVLVNAIIAAWNGYVANDIKHKQVELQQFQSQNQASLNLVTSQLSKKDQDLSRLKFVRDLLPDALTGDRQRSATFLTLVQLTLTDDEYRSLIQALSSSADENLKSVGQQAFTALADTEQQNAQAIIQLVEKISSDDKATRLQAMDEIYKQHIRDTKLISALLEFLSAGSDIPLHIQGRINALFALRATPNNIWTPALVESAKSALANMKVGADRIGPPIGSQTDQVRLEVSAKLALLSSNE